MWRVSGANGRDLKVGLLFQAIPIKRESKEEGRGQFLEDEDGEGERQDEQFCSCFFIGKRKLLLKEGRESRAEHKKEQGREGRRKGRREREWRRGLVWWHSMEGHHCGEQEAAGGGGEQVESEA